MQERAGMDVQEEWLLSTHQENQQAKTKKTIKGYNISPPTVLRCRGERESWGGRTGGVATANSSGKQTR